MPLPSDLIPSVRLPPPLKPFYGEFKSRPVRLLDVMAALMPQRRRNKFSPTASITALTLMKRVDETNRAVIQRFHAPTHVRLYTMPGDPWSGRVWDAFGIAEVVPARKMG